MQTIIVLVTSAIIAAIGYSYFRRIEFSIGTSASARMERFAAADRRNFTDRVGDSLVDRFGLTIEGWEFELTWAQLGGYYEGKTVGSVLGASVVYLLGGIVYILMFQSYSMIYFAAVALIAYYPYMKLKGRGDDVRKMVKRGLPEAAALIAAEMSAGGSAETAVSRAANLPGPLGKMIKDTVAIAQQSGRLIFSRDAIDGVLVEHFHDERGIIWPESVAPYQCHFVALANGEWDMANGIYEKLQSAGIEVLFDDREDAGAGQKFADADLLGIPVRLVVSDKTGDHIEWKKRDSQEVELLDMSEVIKRLKSTGV